MHLAERGQLLQSRAPNIGELDSSWASSVHLFGKTDVIPGGLDVVLVKKRVAWMGQNLIYTPSRHYVTAEKDPHDLPGYGFDWKLFSGDAHKERVSIPT